MSLRIDFDVGGHSVGLVVSPPQARGAAGWLVVELDFLDETWLRQNLVWNLVIGYPF